MKRVLTLVGISILITLGIALTYLHGKSILSAPVEQEQAKGASTQWKVYDDQKLGFSIKYLGGLTGNSITGLTIRLPAMQKEDKEGGFVHIFVDERPFVFLPGTFGGPYYFEEHASAPAQADRVLTEKVTLNGMPATKDYWIIYGGAGSWETVINCYTKYNKRTYIISLHRNFVSGVPGQEIDGKKITKEEIVSRALTLMRDFDNKYVKTFDEMLSTFTVRR